MDIKFKRLMLEIREDDHRHIKQWAAQLGIPMKRFILKAVAAYVADKKLQVEK